MHRIRILRRESEHVWSLRIRNIINCNSMNIDTYINNINIYIHKYIGRGRGQLENQKCSNRTSEHV